MPQTFRQVTTVAISSFFSPQVRAAFLAKTARSIRDDLIASGRASQVFDTAVDGVRDASEDSVQAEGTISYQFSYMSSVAEFTLDWLRQHSPIASGKFRDSFYVGVNNKLIDAADFVPSSVPNGAELIFGNRQPYNRKIDVQMLGYLSIASWYNVEPNLYQRCGDAVMAKFGNTVTAKRVYNSSFPGQYVLRGGRDKGTPVQSPVLVLTPRHL